ncbi:Ltp family lipoprotein [Piscinibacter sp. SJAQ100]|uniref:Ltp family lipoprotein n=2 Tax=Aquariibacter albus TaxID=2759899 RepID=A0A839HGB8_9BURK|nr:Ltp family lipoprotein [Aquariibacter albus]
MVRPTKTFLGVGTTRSKVIKVYGLSFFVLFIAFIVSIPDASSGAIKNTKKSAEISTEAKAENIADIFNANEKPPVQKSEEESTSAETRMTGPQNNAARSARQYLSMQGFSREGLIRQLSSEAGDGYKVSDATVAVDSLNIDWNREAMRSAKQYLDMQGFSCKGLIRQLSSGAGENFTVSQAMYGAREAGACQ